jgi:hypothetical protein
MTSRPTVKETLSLTQNVTPKSAALRSQTVMSKPGRGGRRHRPYAFTEHGALMTERSGVIPGMSQGNVAQGNWNVQKREKPC